MSVYKFFLWIGLLVFLSSFTSASLGDGLVDYWTLDNATASTTVFYNNVSSVPMTLFRGDGDNAGRVGKNLFGVFLDYDGTNTNVVDNDMLVADDSKYRSIVLTGNWSYSGWFNVTGLLSAGRDLGFLRFGGSSGYPTYACGVSSTAGGYINVYYRVGDNKFWISQEGINANPLVRVYSEPTTLVLNQYHHIVLVFNRWNKYLYFDGNLIINSSDGTPFNSNGISQSIIGVGCQWYDDHSPISVVDELAFWNRSLTSTEVQELYNNGGGLFYPYYSTGSFFYVYPTPLNNSVQYYTNNNVTIAVNNTLLGDYIINISFYNSSGFLLDSTSTSDNVSTLMVTGLSPGVYFFNATAYNSTDSIVLDTRKIVIYNITPAVFVSPISSEGVDRFLNISWSNASTTNNSVSISNYVVRLLNDDLSLNRSLFSTNTTFKLFDFYAENLSVGSYYLQVESFDLNNNSVNSTVQFYLLSNALLTFFAGNGSSIYNFSINLTDLNTGIVRSNSTVDGNVSFPIVKGMNYSALIDAEGFAFQSINLSYNNTYNNYTFGLVLSNSVSIIIRDEDSNALIVQNVSIVFIRRSDYLQYSFTVTNGSYFVHGLFPGVYDMTFSSTIPLPYGSRSYIITINDRTTQSLIATLAQSTFNAGFYLKSTSDNSISDATVTISRLVNSSFIVVGSDVTDVLGYVTFNVRNGEEYRFTITSSNYEPRVFDMKVYSINSPYTFRLIKTKSTSFVNPYDYVFYRTLPLDSILDYSSDYSFSLQTSLSNGSLLYQSINCSGSFNESFGSPQGSITYVSVDTTGLSNVICDYNFVFEPFGFNESFNSSWSRMFTVKSLNASLVDSAEYIKEQVDNDAYITILAYVLIFIGAFIVFSWSNGNPYIVSIFILFSIIVFTVLGWINAVMGGVVVAVGIGLLFMQNRGYM